MIIYSTIVTILFLLLCTGLIKSAAVTMEEDISFPFSLTMVVGTVGLAFYSVKRLKEELNEQENRGDINED